jgi:predicted nicotinamide N-methyase
MEVRGVRVTVTEDRVEVGRHELSLLRPGDPDDLLDEAAFERDEFLPYWAELWPTSLALARAVADYGVRGHRVVELGCGLAVPGIVAALEGADVLVTDWSDDAIRFARVNAERNGALLRTAVVSWSEAGAVVADAPWDLVVASDVLYERRNVEQLLGLLPRLVEGGDVLLADPGRPNAGFFLDVARRAGWAVDADPPLYRLSRAPGR